MKYVQINVNSLINKITKKDNLFCGNYTIDPYQNCELGCIYCDSSIDDTIYIKQNASKILDKELKEIKKGKIILGSVNDPYQKAEERYKITKDLLKIIKKNGFSCNILTKSDLILRDIEELLNIRNLTVIITVISIDKKISTLFEKNTVSPKNRIQLVKKLNDNGIKTGIAMIPLLPFVVENDLENIARISKDNNAQFILSKYLELKGYQKERFMCTINQYYPDLAKKYDNLFKNNYLPKKSYQLKIDKKIKNLCKKYGIKNNI